MHGYLLFWRPTIGVILLYDVTWPRMTCMLLCTREAQLSIKAVVPLFISVNLAGNVTLRVSGSKKAGLQAEQQCWSTTMHAITDTGSVSLQETLYWSALCLTCSCLCHSCSSCTSSTEHS